MVDRSITLRLRAQIDGFKRDMDEAASAVQKNTAHIDKLANGAGLLGAAMTGAATLAIKSFADFDQSMSNVQAATHESAGAMGELRDAALEAGKRTKFSATEAAGGIEELAKAGVSTKDILKGGLSGALDLAAAGSLGVAESAEIAATALTQFKLGGDKATHVADLLAAGAGKAQGSVSDMGAALKQAGLVAQSTGLSIEETTAGLAAFASAGLIGSDAGTSFKAMLQRLTPQSAEAQAQMDELSLSAYDGQGNFIGLAEYAGQLQAAMKDMTPEARNSALAVMFGSDAVRAANVLYDEGAAGIAEWTAKVDDSGYAAETAALRMDNLKGDVEQLGGSIETALIELGEGANGPLRSLTQSLTDVVNQFAELPDGVQGATLAIVGGGGLVLLGIAGLAKLVIGIAETKAAMEALGTSTNLTKGKFAALGKVAGVVGIAALASELSQMSGEFEVASVATDDLVESLRRASNSSAAAGDALGDIFEQGWSWSPWRKEIATTGEAIEAFGISAREAMGDDFWDRMDRNLDAGAEMGAFGKQVEQLDAAFAQMVSSGSQDEAADLLKKFTDEAGKQGVPLDKLLEQFPQYAEALKAAADEQHAATLATQQGTEAVEAQIPTLEELIKLQSDAAGTVLSVRDAQREFEAAIDAATEAVEVSTEAGLDQAAMLDITTEAGRTNQAALDDVAESGWGLIDSMRQNGATQAELQATMAVSRQAFLDAAAAMGIGADDANRLADEMGLIPERIAVPVSVDTSVAEASLARLSQLIRNMPDVVITSDMRAEGGYYANRAAGGIVRGPGTSTSDSIRLNASNGEYVIKADSVSKYGERFFDDLNAGRFSMASPMPALSGGGGSRGSSGPLELGTATIRAIGQEIAARPMSLDGRELTSSVDERMGRSLR